MDSCSIIQISVPKLLPYSNYPYTDISYRYRDIGVVTTAGMAPFTSGVVWTTQRVMFRSQNMYDKRLFRYVNWRHHNSRMGDELKIGRLFLR